MLVRLLFAIMLGVLADLITRRLGADSTIAVVIGILVSIIVYFVAPL